MKLHDRVFQILLGFTFIIAALIILFMAINPVDEMFEDASTANTAIAADQAAADEKAKANNKLMETNIAWKDTLQYIQDNPDKSLLYLSTVKDLFFDEKCSFKKNLDFKDLASKYSTVFT